MIALCVIPYYAATQSFSERPNLQEMFQTQRKRSKFAYAFEVGELIFHSVVRDIRKSHSNAVVGLLLNLIQATLFVAAFYAMFLLLGMRGGGIRGDFLLYIMSGIFLFMTYAKTIGSVFGAEGSTYPMMHHAPLNTIVTISAAAISTLYQHTLTLVVALFLYHSLITPISIHDPIGAYGMFLLAWISGVAIGIIFMSIRPWLPNLAPIGQTVYSRVNMIASGKMFVANTLPASMVALFSWNPLFHCIDQARGFVFINYYPHNSSISYPVSVTVGLFMFGLMIEFFTLKNASASWNAGR